MIPTLLPAKTPPTFLDLPKLKPNDRVSIVASSAQIASIFPHLYEFGINRIKNLFNLVPVELPTTRKSGSSLEERATDLMAAFKDPETKAVISLIGGDEQILLLPFLDPEVLKQNPKPFFGYSDNTNLSLYLWSLGIPSFYGGCVFTEYAMLGTMNEFTEKYLRAALFEKGEFEIKPSLEFSDDDIAWDNPENLNQEYEYELNDGWFWDGTKLASGILWGGCLEIIGLQLQVNRWLPHPDAVAGSVLCLETSELVPESWYICDVMRGLGERGYLENLAGLFVARPKARTLFSKQPPKDERALYRKEQREVILKEFRRYNSQAPVVMNMDFGHTKPQIPLPLGKTARIDSKEKRIFLTF